MSSHGPLEGRLHLAPFLKTSYLGFELRPFSLKPVLESKNENQIRHTVN